MKYGRVTIPLGFITTTVGQQDVLPGCTDPLVTTPAQFRGIYDVSYQDCRDWRPFLLPNSSVPVAEFVRPCCRIRLDVLPNSYGRVAEFVWM